MYCSQSWTLVLQQRFCHVLGSQHGVDVTGQLAKSDTNIYDQLSHMEGYIMYCAALSYTEDAEHLNAHPAVDVTAAKQQV